MRAILFVAIIVFLCTGIVTAQTTEQVENLRMRISADGAYNGAYLFDKDESELISVQKDTGFEVSEPTGYVAAIFQSNTDSPIKLELYKTI